MLKKGKMYWRFRDADCKDSMGLVKPINFQRWVLEPINFLALKNTKISHFPLMKMASNPSIEITNGAPEEYLEDNK